VNNNTTIAADTTATTLNHYHHCEHHHLANCLIIPSLNCFESTSIMERFSGLLAVVVLVSRVDQGQAQLCNFTVNPPTLNIRI
jgi:hypothetical protein